MLKVKKTRTDARWRHHQRHNNNNTEIKICREKVVPVTDTVFFFLPFAGSHCLAPYCHPFLLILHSSPSYRPTTAYYYVLIMPPPIIHMFLLAGFFVSDFALSLATLNKRRDARSYILQPWKSESDVKPEDVAISLGEVRVEYVGEILKINAVSGTDDTNDDRLQFRVPIPMEEGNIASSLWPISCAATMWWTRYGKTLLDCITASTDNDSDENAPIRILELGSGLGVTGYAAGAVAARYRDGVSLVLSDQDRDALLRLKVSRRYNTHLNLSVESRFLDWRDAHDEGATVNDTEFDVLVGSDCAYYHHLVGPLADTVGVYGPNALVVVSGPATRRCLWELYHLIRDGGYNAKTDAYGGAWPGTVRMLLYRMYCPEDGSSYRMAVMCWTQNPDMMRCLDKVIRMEETHIASDEDEASIEMGF